MTMVDQNYLFASSAIAARLREACPGFRRVVEVQEASDVLGMPGPVAVVSYMGESLNLSEGQQMRRGADVLARQRWLVELIFDTRNKELTVSKAGYLMLDVIKALQGWKPENAASSLYRVSPPLTTYGNGYAIYPLLFELAVLTSAN